MIKKLKKGIQVVFFVLVCNTTGTVPVCADVNPGIINILTILPGMTREIEIRQQGLFPWGCPQFFVLILGTGTLGISVKKDDVAGDTIFMTGAAISSAGITPIYRAGMSKGMIDQIVEIGSAAQPFGVVWLYCGVVLSQNLPIYNCQVRFSLAQ